MGAGASTGKKNAKQGATGLFGPDAQSSAFKIGGKQETVPIHHVKYSKLATTETAFWRVEEGNSLHIMTLKHDTISGSQHVIANGEQLHLCRAKFKLVGKIDFMLKTKHCKLDMRFKHCKKTNMHYWVYGLFVNGVKVPRLERLTTLHLWTVDVAGTEYEIQFEEESMRIYNNRKLVADAQMGFADVGSSYTFQIAGRRLELQVKPMGSEISVDLLVDGRVWPKLPQSAQSDLREIESGIAKCNRNVAAAKASAKAKAKAEGEAQAQVEAEEQAKQKAAAAASRVSSKCESDTESATESPGKGAAETPKKEKKSWWGKGKGKGEKPASKCESDTESSAGSPAAENGTEGKPTPEKKSWWGAPRWRAPQKQNKEAEAAILENRSTSTAPTATTKAEEEEADGSAESPAAGSSGHEDTSNPSKMEESALV